MMMMMMTTTIIQFSSILYHLCAESTAVRPITDTVHCKYGILLLLLLLLLPPPPPPPPLLLLLLIQFSSIQFFIIYVPS
jgi:hypothetical protein